jgi:hypothetical protein
MAASSSPMIQRGVNISRDVVDSSSVPAVTVECE